MINKPFGNASQRLNRLGHVLGCQIVILINIKHALVEGRTHLSVSQ